MYEGTEITPYTAIPDLSVYGIDGEFMGWEGEPEIMPSRNVYVTAKIVAYKTITYVIGSDFYKTVKLLQGSPVPKMGVPEDLPNDMLFLGWLDEPATADRDTTVHAHYTWLTLRAITYYVNGEVYTTVYYYETKPVTPMEAPKREIYGKEFVRWVGEPEVMPSENVSVNAEYREKTKYTMTYYLDDKFYDSAEYYAGEYIRNMENPIISIPDAEFSGWKGEPEGGIMPSHNVDVYGYIIVGDHDNEFTLKVVNSDESSITLALKVKGKVNVAGFIGEFAYNDKVFNGISADYDDYYMSFGYVDDMYKFIWTCGDNVTEETTFMTITLDRANFDDGASWSNNIWFNINEARAFTEDGGIEAVPYMVTLG